MWKACPGRKGKPPGPHFIGTCAPRSQRVRALSFITPSVRRYQFIRFWVRSQCPPAYSGPVCPKAPQPGNMLQLKASCDADNPASDITPSDVVRGCEETM